MKRPDRDRDGSGILLRVAQRSGAARKRYSGQPDGGTDAVCSSHVNPPGRQKK